MNIEDFKKLDKENKTKELDLLYKSISPTFEEDEIIPNQLVELMFQREEPKEYQWYLSKEINEEIIKELNK